LSTCVSYAPILPRHKITEVDSLTRFCGGRAKRPHGYAAVLRSGFLKVYNQCITLLGSGCVKARMVLRNAGGSSTATSSQLPLPAPPSPPPLVRSGEELGPARTGSPAHISANTQLLAAQNRTPQQRSSWLIETFLHQACGAIAP